MRLYTANNLIKSIKNYLKIFCIRTKNCLDILCGRERVKMEKVKVEKVKVIAIIPSRYASSRFPGKPLVDICGKPMIWWVYNRAKQAKGISDVYVATDDERIMSVCEKNGMNVLMTSAEHKTSTERVFEAANKVKADLYVVINGDEPLINPQIISQVIPSYVPNEMYVGNLMTMIDKPSEVVDFTNIKVVTDEESNAIFFSRSPIPYPKASLDYEYYKHVGVLIYDYAALKFFSETNVGKNEAIEDINELRFIDNGIKIKMIKVTSNSLSVDTPKDLDYIRKEIQKDEKNQCFGLHP